MKKSIIFVGKDFFICNKEKYDFYKINEINHLFRTNMKIIIIEEELWAKQYKNRINRFKLSKFANSVIDKDFPQNGDILYDYEKKNNVIVIYYIKGAKRVEKLVENAKNIEVKPIQFIIKEAMAKVLRSNSFTCNVLIKFEEIYYYSTFEKGLFTYGMVEENKESVLNKMREEYKVKTTYVDESVSDILPLNREIKLEKLNIRRFFNENVYKK